MAALMTNILIDGSVLEGGGQLLRNSISLSALLSKPVAIHSIRHGRKQPGLKNQHRTGLQLAAEIASAQLTGAVNGSTYIEFTPGWIGLPGRYLADSVTAGSTTLLLQVALPLLLFAPSSSESVASVLTLKGGTNATHSPQIDYTQRIFLPFIKRHFGVYGVDLEVTRRGYFPRGGGEVIVRIEPPFRGQEEGQRLKGMSLMVRGMVKAIKGIAHFAGLPGLIGTGMVGGARRRLDRAGYGGGVGVDGRVPIEIQHTRERNDNTIGAGSGIVLWAELEGGGMVGGSAVGKKGVDPEKLGEEAADELIRGLEAGGCVDEWLQDQIIIFMALAEGKSEVRCGKEGLSLHTKTAIWLAEQLTEAKFEVEEEPSGHTIIRCQGIGYTA